MSAIKTTEPSTEIAIPEGQLKLALEEGPFAPPTTPEPAKVSTRPWGVTVRTLFDPQSATKRRPPTVGLSARPAGPLKRAAAPAPSAKAAIPIAEPASKETAPVASERTLTEFPLLSATYTELPEALTASATGDRRRPAREAIVSAFASVAA